MAFQTVAIIQYSIKKEETSEHVTYKTTKFLVQFENEKYSFWYFNNNAIGAGFQRDLLDKKFKKTFGLSLSEQAAEKFAEREYEGEEKPSSVVYQIDLSEDSYFTLFEKLRDNSTFKWLSYDEYKEVKNKFISSQNWIIEKADEAEFYQDKLPINVNFIEKVNQLIKAKQDGNLVVFVGAGISNSSGVPLWGELVKKMTLSLGDIDVDYEKNPQLYHQEHGEVNYYKKIEDILDLDNKKPNIIHSEIFKLNPSHIITTNYDNFLEKENSNQGKNYFVIKKDQDLPYSSSDKLIIKMHGDLETRNIVLKEDDYFHYSDNFKLIEYFIKSVFSSKQVLFIGFSFSDRNLKLIIESVRTILKNSYKPPFLFIPKSENRINTRDVNYFKNRGINVIGYENEIENYLHNYAKLPKTDRNEDETESNYILKKDTFNFLRFLGNYTEEDWFYYSSKEMNVIDKMYSGLIKYQDIPVIPYLQLVKIKPFAYNNDSAEYHSYGYHLKTPSEEIIKLLSKIDKIHNSVIYYKDLPNKPEQDYNKNNKLTQIFKWLRSSAVYCVQRKYDFIDEIHNNLTLQQEEEKCQCPTCLLNDFKYHEAYLTGINSYDNEDSEFCYIKKAKVCFFFAEYEKCFKYLKKGAAIAYSNKRYHLYFLHIYNISLLKYRIEGLFVPDHISKERKNEILLEIEYYDLPSIIEELNISHISKEILHSIWTKDIYHDSFDKIIEDVKNIEKLFKSHRNGTSYFIGPNYANNLIYNYSVYLHYTTNNFLFDIFYNKHDELTCLFAKGIFTSFVSHDTLKQKINEVSFDEIKPIIKYANPEKLFEIIQSTLIKEHKNLKLNENESSNFFSILDEFVKSQITIKKFWRENIELRNEIEYSKRRHFIVNQRFRYVFDNIIIITSQLIEQFLNDVKFIEYLTNIFKYIKVANDQPFSDDKYFELFLSTVLTKIKNFDRALVLESCINENIWSGRFIEIFVKSLDNNTNFKISSKDFFDQIIYRANDREAYKIELKDLLPLYRLMETNLQIEYLNLFNTKYMRTPENVLLLVNVGISDVDLLDNLKESFFEVVLSDPEFEENNQIYLINHLFWKYYRLFINDRIKFSVTQVAKIEKQKNVFSWLLYPESFDYSKFEKNWLELLRQDEAYWNHLGGAKNKIKILIEGILKEKFNMSLSEMYWKYLN